MESGMEKIGKKLLLSIAGYDPSAGAGVLLDVAVFRRFGFIGAGLLTAVTAQNSRRVTGVHCLGGRFLLQQYEAIVEDIAPSGIKVGMLGGRGRTQPQPGDQFFQAPLIPLGRDLNPSILQIPDPPAEAEGNGPAPGVVAEKNALNAARNKDMDSSFHRRERYATIAAPGP